MKRHWLGLIAAVILVAAVFVQLLHNVKESGDISFYQALSGEIPGKAAIKIFGSDYVECPYDLPKLGQLGSYTEVRFNHMAKRYGFFISHSYVLVVHYDPAGYVAQKANLEEKYTFCPPEKDDTMSGYTYSMDGFDIRAVEGGWYPKEMFFLGFSDERREIAIVYYYNQDLDYVNQPLGKFLSEETGWDKVVNN